MKSEATKDQTRNRLHQHYTEWFTGDGAKLEFLLEHAIGLVDDVTVFVNGNRMRPNDRGTAYDFKIRGHTPGYDGEKNALTFAVAPALNADICVDVVST